MKNARRHKNVLLEDFEASHISFFYYFRLSPTDRMSIFPLLENSLVMANVSMRERKKNLQAVNREGAKNLFSVAGQLSGYLAGFFFYLYCSFKGIFISQFLKTTNIFNSQNLELE